MTVWNEIALRDWALEMYGHLDEEDLRKLLGDFVQFEPGLPPGLARKQFPDAPVPDVVRACRHAIETILMRREDPYGGTSATR